jgi:NAD(P)-dependent dehydrogenase (short-subunit alcohol dehydrogenase family)
MPDRVAVVTGGTAGIGRATAEGLAGSGFTVTIVGHNRERGERVAREIQERPDGGQVSFEAADLTSLDDAHALGERLVRRHPRLDVVVHNFGGMYRDRQVTRDGYEATLATNVLTPLRLTQELLPALRAAAPSRVVFVNSDAHRWAKPEFDDLGAERFYRGFDVHARAKLIQLLTVRHVSPELSGSGVSVLLVNPGGAWTEQVAAMRAGMMPPVMRLWWPMIRLVQRGRSARSAARPVLRAAVDPALDGRTRVWITQSGKVGEPSPTALDDSLAARVYGQIAGMIGGMGPG